MATWAREMSAKVTGRDSRMRSRSVTNRLRGGGDAADDVVVVASSCSSGGMSILAENGRGVVMGYLNPAAARAKIAARLDAVLTDVRW